MKLSARVYMNCNFHTLIFESLDLARETSEPVLSLTRLLAEALVVRLIVGLCLWIGPASPSESRLLIESMSQSP